MDNPTQPQTETNPADGYVKKEDLSDIVKASVKEALGNRDEGGPQGNNQEQPSFMDRASNDEDQNAYEQSPYEQSPYEQNPYDSYSSPSDPRLDDIEKLTLSNRNNMEALTFKQDLNHTLDSLPEKYVQDRAEFSERATKMMESALKNDIRLNANKVVSGFIGEKVMGEDALQRQTSLGASDLEAGTQDQKPPDYWNMSEEEIKKVAGGPNGDGVLE